MSLRGCQCFLEYYHRQDELENIDSDEEYDALEKMSVPWREKTFHNDETSETTRAWDVVLQVIEDAKRNSVTDLDLSDRMDREDYLALNTLPETIGDLKDLRRLILFRSNVSSIPREIEGCVNLQTFEPYGSYRLHWFPIEILNCVLLQSSTVSTRALYGNNKFRPPFPNLRFNNWKWKNGIDRCAVCRSDQSGMEQYWITRRVGTDFLPLLTSVCGQECLSTIRCTDNKEYLRYPHQGGLIQLQPFEVTF